MEKFILNITASSGEFYQGYCESLTLPTGDGVYGVQAGHNPVLVALHMGIAKFTVDGETREVLVGDGIAEVTPTFVLLLVDSAERPEDIDRRGSPHPGRGAPAAQAEHARVLPEQDRTGPRHAAPADGRQIQALNTPSNKTPSA
jgi:F-type H+-transporting ATPase subunit epsilon